MNRVDPKHLQRIPISRVTIPFDGARVLTDRWWVIVDECILIYRKISPQCNSIKEIAEKVGRRCHGEEAEVRFLPVVYIHDEHD